MINQNKAKSTNKIQDLTRYRLHKGTWTPLPFAASPTSFGSNARPWVLIKTAMLIAVSRPSRRDLSKSHILPDPKFRRTYRRRFEYILFTQNLIIQQKHLIT